MQNQMSNPYQTPMTNILSSGISQPSKFAPKKVIKIFGQEFVLCKDATDSTVSFPHNRVRIQNGDCIPMKDETGNAYFCFLHGVIQPLPNSLEKPVDVYYVGFHRSYVDMRFITPNDVARMHVYKVDNSNWAKAFVHEMLSINSVETDTASREPISPWLDDMIGGNQQVQSAPQQQASNAAKPQNDVPNGSVSNEVGTTEAM